MSARIITFLAQNRDIEFVGIKLGVETETAVVWAAPRKLGRGFRIHNVGDIDSITHYLRCNREVKTLKLALLDDGRVILRSLATISDSNFEIDGYISPPDQEPGEQRVSAQQQLHDWLDNFAKKLANVRRQLSKQHA